MQCFEPEGCPNEVVGFPRLQNRKTWGTRSDCSLPLRVDELDALMNEVQ